MQSEVEAIQKIVQAISDDAESFALDIPDALTLDGNPIPQDAAMAIILDGLLAKDLYPDGFEEIPGGRRYWYRKDD